VLIFGILCFSIFPILAPQVKVSGVNTGFESGLDGLQPFAQHEVSQLGTGELEHPPVNYTTNEWSVSGEFRKGDWLIVTYRQSAFWIIYTLPWEEPTFEVPLPHFYVSITIADPYQNETTFVQALGLNQSAQPPRLVSFPPEITKNCSLRDAGALYDILFGGIVQIAGVYRATMTAEYRMDYPPSYLGLFRYHVSATDSWPMYLHDLNRTGYSTVRGPKTNQTRWTYLTQGAVFSHPSVADGIVFIGSNDRKFYALNETNGALIWNYTTGGTILSGSAVANGIVYTGSQDYKVYALNETTGTLIWNYTTGHQIYSSSPAVADGIVYIGSKDYKLYALNATTGAHIWNYTTSGEILSSPAVVGGIVYIGSRAGVLGALYALNATTGDFIWQYNTGEIYYSSPVISEGVIYVGTTMASSSKLYALNASTGSFIWSYPSVGSIDIILNSAAVAYGMVYFGSNDHYLYALNKTSGGLIWRYFFGGTTRVWSAPAVADGFVYIGDAPTGSAGKFYAINALTGDLI